MWVTVIVSVGTKAAANTVAGFTGSAWKFLWYWKAFKRSLISPDSFINMPHTPPERAVVSAVLTKTACLSSKNLYCFELDYRNTSLSLRFLFCISLPQWLIPTSYLFCQSFLPFDQGFNTFRIYPERHFSLLHTSKKPKTNNNKTTKHKSQPNKKPKNNA